MDSMEISYETMEHTIARAYRKSGVLPEKYPDIERIDDIIYRTEFLNRPRVREKIFKYMVINLVYGFDRDGLWHKANPGFETPTAYNLYRYITTPYVGDGQLLPHVNIWENNTPENKKEDIQASFEYMQGMIIDGDFFRICPPKNSEIKTKQLVVESPKSKQTM